jgi:phosphoribosylglycinamide formyltransferase-1
MIFFDKGRGSLNPYLDFISGEFKKVNKLMNPNRKKKILFLASGRGSNFQAVLRNLESGSIQGTPIGLISDKIDAPAIEFAQSKGIPCFPIPFSREDKEGFHLKILQKTQELGPDLILTCGYMRILQKDFIQAFPGKIINIHPSLLPAFPGIHSQKQAFDYGVQITGCTVHFVDEGVDTGPIILQEIVKIEPHMTEKDLTDAILAKEHKILSEAVSLFCEDRLLIQGRKVVIRDIN